MDVAAIKAMKTMLKVLTRFFAVSKAIFNRIGAIAVVMMLGLFAIIALAADPEDQAASENRFVGEVRLVLGKAYLQQSDQEPQQIQLGTRVKVGDRVVTEADGHVHIRFIDQALVSVRPGSSLVVARYDFNAQSPEFSAVKFNLIEGVMRSISGDASKSANNRFRFNTPIAAIGVRGADFLVSATDQLVRVRVNKGNIVMAPFSGECTPASFGPCAINAVELAGDSLQIIELDSTEAQPRISTRATLTPKDSFQLLTGLSGL